MIQTFSAKYADIFTTKARYILLWGGRARGGSFTATNYFLHLVTRPEHFRGYIMRQVFGDIRDSLWRDFQDRIEENETLNPKTMLLNESRMKARCMTTGNMIFAKGFKKSSKSRTGKLKSLAGATHVVIEEADEIDEEDFQDLDDTIRKQGVNIQIILIFNSPPKAHWIWRKWFTLMDINPFEFNDLYGTELGPDDSTGYYRAILRQSANALSIHSTFRDNLENLNQSFIQNLEAYQASDPEHFYTMVEGLISEGVRGRIYRNWHSTPVMPGIWKKFYGLDWGFSGDPLALVEMERHDKNLYIDQKIYAHNMTNDDLDAELTRLGIRKSDPIVADNSQPKDIMDMRRKGWNFIPCIKGPGSVRSGVRFVKQFDVFLTETSVDIWKENEIYAYSLDQYKNPTNEPEDKNDHAMNAIVYGLDRIRVRTGRGIKIVK